MKKRLFNSIFFGLFLILIYGCSESAEVTPDEQRDYWSQDYQKFKVNFESTINVMAPKFASIEKTDFEINENYDEICFLKSKKYILKNKGEKIHSFDIEKMYVDNDFCVNPIGGMITLRIECKGDSANVSIWE